MAEALDRIDAYVWRISAVVVVGSIMSILDTTIVNVALATLSRELHATIDQIQWVVTRYLLSLAAVIPASGWASRRVGAKRGTLASLVRVTAALRVLPTVKPAPAGRLDFLGLGLMATGLPLLTYGLAEIGATGSFTSPKVVVPILGGLALITAFALHALRVPRPLLNVRLYRRPTFS